MRRPFAIFAVVLTYTLLEILLLFSTFVFNNSSPYESLLHRNVYLIQLLLIPGMSALCHFLFYRTHWMRATLITLATGVSFFLAYLLSGMSVVIVAMWLELEPSWAVLALIIVALAIWFCAALFLTKNLRHRAVTLESQRWLAERQLYPDASERLRHDRTVRWALCIPSLTVLFVFLYLPQVWGLVSRAANPHAGDLKGYTVTVPRTWPVLGSSGKAVSGLALTSIASGLNRYRHFDIPLSFWYVHLPTEPVNDWTPYQKRAELARRTFALGNETLTCIEMGKPPELHYSFPARSRYAEIKCVSTGPFRASFFGEREHVDAFYHMLSTVTRTAP